MVGIHPLDKSSCKLFQSYYKNNYVDPSKKDTIGTTESVLISPNYMYMSCIHVCVVVLYIIPVHIVHRIVSSFQVVFFIFQTSYWGSATAYKKVEKTTQKPEPTLDKQRFSMLFKHLSPMSFGDHSEIVAEKAFLVSLINPRVLSIKLDFVFLCFKIYMYTNGEIIPYLVCVCKFTLCNNSSF